MDAVCLCGDDANVFCFDHIQHLCHICSQKHLQCTKGSYLDWLRGQQKCAQCKREIRRTAILLPCLHALHKGCQGKPCPLCTSKWSPLKPTPITKSIMTISVNQGGVLLRRIRMRLLLFKRNAIVILVLFGLYWAWHGLIAALFQPAHK